MQKTTNPTNQPTSSRTSKRTPSSDRLAIIDWSQVANDLKDRSRHVDKFKPSLALEQQLTQLSKSDLLAALDATLKGDLDAQDKVNLTRYLTTLLIHVRREQDRPAGIFRIQESLKAWEKGYRTWVPAITVADYFDKISATPKEQELCLDEIQRQFKYYQPDGDPTAFRNQFTAEVQEIRSNN